MMTDEQPRDLDQEIAQIVQPMRKPQSFRTAPSEDPGLTAEQAALQRARRLVDDMRGGSIQQLTEMRDTIDDLMRAITAKSDEVEDSIAGLASMVQTSVMLVAEMRPRIDEQARKVRAGLAPPPGQVVTQR